MVDDMVLADTHGVELCHVDGHAVVDVGEASGRCMTLALDGKDTLVISGKDRDSLGDIVS